MEQGITRMLDHLSICHFRGFRALKMERLARVNLIAGKNGAGKTSLLEALFLLAGAGNINLFPQLQALWGLGSNVESVPLMGETAWAPLFHALDAEHAARIAGRHSQFGDLTLKLALERRSPTSEHGRLKQVDIPPWDKLGTASPSTTPSLVSCFSRSSHQGKPVQARINVKGTELEIAQDAYNALFPAVINLPAFRHVQEDARRLGALRQQKKGDRLVQALKVVEPDLQDVEVNSVNGAPEIWVDIGLPELIPLTALGEGLTYMTRLVLAITAVPNGLLLIDEWENGLHHSVLTQAWQVIAQTAKEFKVQIFATTHSFECIRAAYEALGGGFRLHRLEASGSFDDRQNRCITYEERDVAAVMRHNMEVR